MNKTEDEVKWAEEELQTVKASMAASTMAFEKDWDRQYAILQAAKAHKEELDKTITEMSPIKVACAEKKSQLETKIQSKTIAWQQSEQRITSSRNRTVNADTDTAKATAMIKETRKEIQELETATAAHGEILRSLEAKEKIAASKMQRKQQELSAITKETSDLEQTCFTLEANVKNLQAQNKTLEAKIIIDDEKLEAFLQRTHGSTADELNRKALGQQQESELKVRQIKDATKRQLLCLKSEICSRLEKQNKHLDEKMAGMEHELTELRGKNAHIRAEKALEDEREILSRKKEVVEQRRLPGGESVARKKQLDARCLAAEAKGSRSRAEVMRRQQEKEHLETQAKIMQKASDEIRLSKTNRKTSRRPPIKRPLFAPKQRGPIREENKSEPLAASFLPKHKSKCLLRTNEDRVKPADYLSLPKKTRDDGASMARKIRRFSARFKAAKSKSSRASNERTTRQSDPSKSKKNQKYEANSHNKSPASKSKKTRKYDEKDSRKADVSKSKKSRRYNMIDARKLRRFRRSSVSKSQQRQKESSTNIRRKPEKSLVRQHKKKKSFAGAADWSDDDLFSFGL